MAKKICLAIILFLVNFFCHAQEIRYKEKANESYTRFFYDDNYYLVDKNCEFKAIERVAQYDTVNFKFNGEFKDFNPQGRLILHGFYKNGLKNGKFTAYHPNGQMKWESTFVADKETGLWKYYYPDGKPMLTLSLDSGDFKFVDFWDTFGHQKIKNGEGEYNIDIKIKGFTDHGYTSYNTRGTVANGKPNGPWFTYFIIAGNKKQFLPIFTEKFENGKRTSFRFYEDFMSGLFIPYEDFPLVPSDFFGRAELFVLNNCSFDDYSGFKNFLGRKINHWLSKYTFNIPNDTFQFQFKYTVAKNGIPSNIELINSPHELNKHVKNRIIGIFNSLNYFIPSILDGKPIKDNITITADMNINNQNFVLHYLKIEREKGQ